MSLIHRAACLLGLLLVLSGSHAGAEEEKPRYTLRIFDISGLTIGRPHWIPESPPIGIDEVSDEDRPLFGAEGEQRDLPIGVADELIQRIRADVAPRTWEDLDGVDMAAFGEGSLVAYTTPEVLDQMAAYLGALERRVNRTVAVDIRVLDMAVDELAALRQGADGQVLDAARVGAVDALGAHGFELGLYGHPGHRVALYSGTQRAYLADYDVEVAEKAKISDPIVMVDNLGAVVAAVPVLSADGASCVLDLQGFLAVPEELGSVAAGEQDRLIEVPITKLASLNAHLRVPVGAWALVGAQPIPGTARRWVFITRVRIAGDRAAPVPAQGVALTPPPAVNSGEITSRGFDVRALTRAIPERMGRNLDLWPSNFTPPSPPELREPAPIIYDDALRDLMQLLLAPDGWNQEGMGITMRRGQMQVRHRPTSLDAVGQALAALRKGLRTMVLTEATLYAVDQGDARKMGLHAGASFEPAVLDTLATLVSQERASVLASGRTRNVAGNRAAAESYRRVPFLQDYEVEIASDAVIANPIVNYLYSGSVLDLEAALSPSRKSVCAVMRFTRSAVDEPLRRVRSPHGDITVPAMDVFRSRSSFVVPVGRATVVSTASAGSKRHVLVLTSRVVTD